MLTSSIPRRGHHLAVVLTLMLAVFGGPSAVWAHDDSAYSHESAAASFNPQWMLTIGAAKKLTELSLPGSHDSGTYTGIGGDIAQTQTMNIRAQLDSGIRYLDIRLKYYDRFALRNCNATYTSANCDLLIFHGGIDMFVSFETGVLRPVLSLLKANPSEIVLMRIAMEDANCDCNPGPALNVLLAKEAVLDGASTGRQYSDYLLPNSCPAPDQLTLGPVRPLNAGPDPSSCDPRGKVLVFDQFLNGTLIAKNYYRHNGLITYTSPTFETLRTNFDLYDRLWLPVKGHLFNAGKSAVMTDFYLTGIGGAGGGFPYFFASGHSNPQTDAPRLSTGLVDGITADASTYPDFPRTSCLGSICTISFEGMNTLVADYLLHPEFHLTGSRVGIVSADFPGARLILAVASVNKGVTFNRPTFAYNLTTSTGAAYNPGTWTNRQVVITPVCNFFCTGDRSVVSEDAPNGFTYNMSSAIYGVSFTASPVRIDPTPPTVVAAATTPPVRNGWYTSNVVVRFTCADTGGSGIADCPADQVLSNEGTAISTARFATDVAGNKSNSSNVVTVKIDKTPPVVTYKGNLGSYSPAQTVNITCSVQDKDSGVAATTCADIRGPASSFGPGSHSYSASAIDVAGNTGTAAVTFTVVTLPGDLNFDGAVDCRDQAIVKASFGKRSGMPGFDARADVNSDGVVDIRDLSFIAQKLPAGTSCP